MIRKQLDSVTLNSYTGSNNELIVPSKVMTSYAKSDASDLSYTNFMISTEMNASYVGDIYVGGRFPVTFEGDESASCYMNVVSWCNTKNGVKLTLMYSDGLTVDDSSDDSSDDGSSDDPATYNINESTINFCTVTIEPNPATEGETVTVTVTPDQGNVFDSIEAHGMDTNTYITITDLGNNQYSFTMPAEDVDLSVNCISSGETNPQTLSEVRQLENNTEFTFDGTVTVINKSSKNRELYIQDADGSAGIKMYQSNIGSSFSTGDVIYNGWTATKSVYNGVTQLGSISNLNYSGDTTKLIANELSISSFTESDTYNYYVFRNITINGNAIEDGEGNTMSIYNQFSTTIPSDAQHYDAYGVVAWYNNAAQLYPMSFEPVDDGSSDDGSSDDPDEPTETITWSQDPFVVNATAGSQSSYFVLTGTDSNSNSITVERDVWNYTIDPDDGVIIGGTKVERFVADATNLTAGTYNYDIACEHHGEYGVAHIQVVVS